MPSKCVISTLESTLFGVQRPSKPHRYGRNIATTNSTNSPPRFRSLTFNIKDAKNDLLWRRIVNGEIEPNQLVKMGANELSIEMARWREREAQHNLDLYKKEAAMNVTDKVRCLSVIIPVEGDPVRTSIYALFRS